MIEREIFLGTRLERLSLLLQAIKKKDWRKNDPFSILVGNEISQKEEREIKAMIVNEK